MSISRMLRHLSFVDFAFRAFGCIFFPGHTACHSLLQKSVLILNGKIARCKHPILYVLLIIHTTNIMIFNEIRKFFNRLSSLVRTIFFFKFPQLAVGFLSLLCQDGNLPFHVLNPVFLPS